MTGRPVDQALVREALGDLLRHAVRVVTRGGRGRGGVRACCGCAAGTLQSKARAWAVSHPRMIAMYLCRKHTAATYGEISKHFGAKTHSTAVAAEKKVRAWLEKDASVAIGDRDWPAKELHRPHRARIAAVTGRPREPRPPSTPLHNERLAATPAGTVAALTAEDSCVEPEQWAAPRLKLGDRVKIRLSGGMKGRIVELRGPLGPGGAQVYRVQYRRKPTPAYIEVLEDQLEVMPTVA